MTERWAHIEGSDGYEVSTLGRVKSPNQIVVYSDGRSRHQVGRIMSPAPHSSGYRTVLVRPRRRYVHTLVLEAFVGPRPEDMQACHNNGDPWDCRLSNLRWGTASDNMLDRVRHGNHFAAQRTHCPLQHPLVEPNLIPSQTAIGRRSCLACQRARGHRYYRRIKWGIEVDLKPVADAYLDAILRDAGQDLADALLAWVAS